MYKTEDPAARGWLEKGCSLVKSCWLEKGYWKAAPPKQWEHRSWENGCWLARVKNYSAGLEPVGWNLWDWGTLRFKKGVPVEPHRHPNKAFLEPKSTPVPQILLGLNLWSLDPLSPKFYT